MHPLTPCHVALSSCFWMWEYVLCERLITCVWSHVGSNAVERKRVNQNSPQSAENTSRTARTCSPPAPTRNILRNTENKQREGENNENDRNNTGCVSIPIAILHTKRRFWFCQYLNNVLTIKQTLTFPSRTCTLKYYNAKHQSVKSSHTLNADRKWQIEVY